LAFGAPTSIFIPKAEKREFAAVTDDAADTDDAVERDHEHFVPPVVERSPAPRFVVVVVVVVRRKQVRGDVHFDIGGDDDLI